MKKNKPIVAFLVFIAILSVVTIAYIVLKHYETPNRVLYDCYSDKAIWGIVVWQIVIIIAGILLWAKVFKDVPRPALYIGRGMITVVCLGALLFLSGIWLKLAFDNTDSVVIVRDEHILIKDIGYDGEASYSLWTKDGFFYRKFGVNIGYYADSVAEGIFYSYVNRFADNTGVNLEEHDELSEEQTKEYQYLNKFIEITENTYPEKYQRGLYWQEKDLSNPFFIMY